MQPQREKIIIRSADETLVRHFARELRLPAPIAKILVLRGLKTIDACNAFFEPRLEHLRDPFLFTDMNKATDRIAAAIAGKQRIAVYGDYDVDGITATVIVLKTLQSLGADCEYYLPNRLTEGYGISSEGITKLAQHGIRLIITVDCGICAHAQALAAKSLGMDLIITDHHEPKETLPDAFAILDPKTAASGYPDDSLAGVGVALKLCHALAKKNNKPDEFWTTYLDLAAVGTAADVVQLVGENRIIAALGFQRLQHTENIGLAALIAQQGLTGKKMSTGEVGFQIAPCINAVGRLGDPRRGVELLLTGDSAAATSLARELKQANLERRGIDKAMQEEAFAWVDQNVDPMRDYAIVIAKPTWHCGVVGIVASKVADRYHRPTLLFAVNEEGIARGSGRSVPSVNLHKVLGECKPLLESFGGHAAAAGMTIKIENLEEFRLCFGNAVKRITTLDDMAPCVNADASVELGECTWPFFNMLKKLAPFGPGNPRPLFVCQNLTHRYEPRIVGSQHVKMMVARGAVTMDAVAFNFGHRLSDLKAAASFSAAFSLDENEWNGRTTLQMKVKGVDV